MLTCTLPLNFLHAHTLPSFPTKGKFFWSLFAFTREYRESDLHSRVIIETKTTRASINNSVAQWYYKCKHPQYTPSNHVIICWKTYRYLWKKMRNILKQNKYILLNAIFISMYSDHDNLILQVIL